VSGRGTTRRGLLAAAGAVIVAPGCLGSASRPASTGEPPRAPLTGPLRVVAGAGAVSAADRHAFARDQNVAVEVRTVGRGRPLIELLSSGYPADAVLARQDDVAVLGALGLLADLDHDRVPNLDRVDPGFLDLDYDRHNRWSAPARWGVYGFGYRSDIVTGAPRDWAGFFALLPSYSLQGVALLPGPIEPVAAALAALDEDLNTDDDATLVRARSLLVSARPHVNTFAADPVLLFGSGELVLAMGSSADFDRIAARPDRAADTVFVLPHGRSEMWIDGWAIPAAAAHPRTALAWIDERLAPAAQARAWAASRIPASEAAAARLLPASVRADRLAAPDPALVKRYEPAVTSPAGLQKRAEIWEAIR